MSVTLSASMLAAIFAASTSEGLIALVEFTDGTTTLRYAEHPTDVTWSGDTYTARGMEPVPPDEREDTDPEATLSVDDIDQALIAFLRATTAAITVTMSLIRLGSFSTSDAAERSWTFRLLDSTADDTSFRVTITSASCRVSTATTRPTA